MLSAKYGQPVENAREAAQHVVEQNRGIWTDNPFDRRMADVALVPQRHVFHRRQGVAPKQAGQAGEVFGGNRVALMGHCRRALLPLRKILFNLPDLSVLEQTYLGCHFFDRTADYGQC